MTRRNRQTRALMENTGPRPGATFRQSVRLWQARYQAERAAQAAPPEEEGPAVEERRRREAVLAWLSGADGR
jgi:hypothetical protein